MKRRKVSKAMDGHGFVRLALVLKAKKEKSDVVMMQWSTDVLRYQQAIHRAKRNQLYKSFQC